MADCNVSIDQKNLPGVKEVCRDFAVLEDHSLAYNLQEQEIESHLASNVHKSRLVQQDLQVAKRLQEEEDLRAQAQSRRKQTDIERHDTEIAHEIQEELVRQAEQQRQQEEKDAAIARKLQEKEMKGEKKRQKHLEPNFDDEYFEEKEVRKLQDLDRATTFRSLSPSHHEVFVQPSPHRDYSPDYISTKPKRSPYHKTDPAASHNRFQYPEHYVETELRGRHADPYPEHMLPSRGKHGKGYPDYVPTEMSQHHTVDSERAVRRKEKPSRPPPPQTSRERDKGWEQDRPYDRHDIRGREEVHRYNGAREHSYHSDRGSSADRLLDKERHRNKDFQRIRTRSRDRLLDEGGEGPVFREFWDPQLRDGPDGWSRDRKADRDPNVETGSGEVVTDADYKLTEATKGLTKLDIHEQELKDREVARKLQEEELKKNSTITRAAQVAQDEEIARLLMEKEKKEYKKQREREKDRQREKDRLAMDRAAAERKRYEAEYRPNSEEVVRPRTRDEYEYQREKNHNKPSRPPQPRPHGYVNVTPAYNYPDQPLPPRAPNRPEPTSRGAYYKR